MLCGNCMCACFYLAELPGYAAFTVKSFNTVTTKHLADVRLLPTAACLCIHRSRRELNRLVCTLISEPVQPAGASPTHLLHFSVVHYIVVHTSCNLW